MSARKIFYMFVMLIVSQTVAAESLNYFQNSTEWVSEGRGTQWGAVQHEERTWLGEKILIADYEASELWYKDGDMESNLTTYVRTQGDKVYFLVDKDAADWRLLYDFALQPGEGVEVWYFNGMIGLNISPMSEYLVCEEIRPCEDNPSITEMVMLCYDSKDTYESSPENFMGRCVWLQGIGNKGNPLYNIWGDGIDGVIFRLLLVESEGEVVYRAPGYTGMQGVSDARIEVQAGCGEICVKGADATRVRVFGADGVARRGRDGVYDGLSKGVYIVQVAESTMTVMVR